MTITNAQKALLHVAKTKLKLADDTYRQILVHVAGCTSSTELDRGGFEAVMGFMEYLGFRPLKKIGPDFGARPGMASFAQVELIRALWAEWSNGNDGLNNWLVKFFKVSSLRFLTVEAAPKVIAALKAMKTHKRAA